MTLWYRPPDVLLGSTNYTTSLDLWGVGCILLEMLMGAPSFPGVRDALDQLDKIFKVQYRQQHLMYFYCKIILHLNRKMIVEVLRTINSIQ